MEQNKFYQIKNITEHEYTLVGCDGSVITRPIQDVDRLASAFTIQDAMDGDVLCVKYGNDEMPFIFTGKQHDVAYCALNSFGEFVLSMAEWLLKVSVLPATKEQRDLLFQKMKEAGYIFDFKNKELKKIKNDIEIPFGAKDSELQEATYFIPKGFHAEIDNDKVVIKKGEKPTAWSEGDELHIRELESLVKQVWATAERENDKETIHKMSDLSFFLKTLKPQLKREWSEEDEKMFEYALNRIEWYSDKNEDKSKLVSNWLKSLSPHKQWKPSEKQMDALKNLNLTGGISYVGQGQTLIELYKDLKKLTE